MIVVSLSSYFPLLSLFSSTLMFRNLLLDLPETFTTTLVHVNGTPPRPLFGPRGWSSVKVGSYSDTTPILPVQGVADGVVPMSTGCPVSVDRL